MYVLQFDKMKLKRVYLGGFLKFSLLLTDCHIERQLDLMKSDSLPVITIYLRLLLTMDHSPPPCRSRDSQNLPTCFSVP